MAAGEMNWPATSLAYRAASELREMRTPGRSTPAAAFHAARQVFLASEKLDMRRLAAHLEVGRTTLYRWSGGREQLIIDVIWSFTDAAVEAAWTTNADLEGVARLLGTARSYLQVLTSFAPLAAFLRNETHFALRLLTSGPYQQRLVAKVERLLQEEAERAGLELRAESGLLAYATVRLLEGFAYNDSIADLDVRTDDALEILTLILT
ncbi:QsdR family transcriptional regulator [Nocardia sp. NPDC050435]|uniref:QsdR family transcriptional regulator n=1 Tax=Nocardia sp. NPDC050435 TaxID=3155040 RepID=UPI0033BFFF63